MTKCSQDFTQEFKCCSAIASFPDNWERWTAACLGIFKNKLLKGTINVLLRPFRHVLCLCYKTWQGKAGGFFFWRLMLFPSYPAIALCCTARRSHSREYLSCIWPEIGWLISLLLLELLPPFTLLNHLCWGGHILNMPPLVQRCLAFWEGSPVPHDRYLQLGVKWSWVLINVLPANHISSCSTWALCQENETVP